MASFGFSDEDSVTMRNAVFRLILSRAADRLTEPADADELEMAEAFGGLSFRALAEPQRGRLVHAVFQGTKQLKWDISLGEPLEEEVLPGIDDKLDELLTFLAAHLTPDPGGH
jgi:hypothetical protein